MRIETEFCPEDEVYVLHNEEIVRAKILKIEIIATFEENIIRYNIKLEDRKTPMWVYQSRLYSSIDILLEQMRNKFLKECRRKNEHTNS